MRMIFFYFLELKPFKRMKGKWIKLGIEVLKAVVYAVAGFFSSEIF